MSGLDLPDSNTNARDVTAPRPNPLAPFHCGLSMGKPCTWGPTPSGKCCQDNTFQHSVAARQHSSHESGGDNRQLQQSDTTPEPQDCLPCIPIKNSWHSRNLLAVNLAVLAGGVLLVCMAIPENKSIFAPGDLSKSHSQILAKTLTGARCGACHPNAHPTSNAVTQEQLCMNCHQAHMPNAIYGFPHDSSTLQATNGNDSQTRCAQCHREHHGNSRDLRAITDARCQSCHQQQFASFSHGHPEFTQYPSTVERRIAFDHQAHLEKHFLQTNTSFDCNACHRPNNNSATQVVRTVDFEQACASCHENSLKASAAEGWALLQLPSLNASDIPIGGEWLQHWPPGSQYGYDGPITLPMRLLMAGDPQIAQALAMFPEGDLSRTRQDDPNQQAAARTIAVATGQLIMETASQGQAAWTRRLSKLVSSAYSRSPTAKEQKLIQSMVAGLPPDLFRQMQFQWFGAQPPIAETSPPGVSANLISNQHPTTSGQLIDDSSEGLLDDELSPSQLLEGEDVDDLLKKPSTFNLGQESNAFQESTPSPLHPELPDRGKLSKSDAVRRWVGSEHLSEGGWYVDSELYSLRYMPRGHADPVVAAWLQFATLIHSASHPTNDQKNSLHPAWRLPDWSSEKLAVGLCTECHLLPDIKTANFSGDDWKSENRGAGRGFTRFDHRPHLTLAGSAECQDCHRMNESNPSRYALVKKQSQEKSPGDRIAFLTQALDHFCREFDSIEKSQCNSCHRPGGAPQGCTQCHNYHVDSDY